MNGRLEQGEMGVWAAGLTLLLVAVWGPTVLQPAHHHDFADTRTWRHLPCAMDVLSNAPFALWGAVELADHDIYARTSQLGSGHSLKYAVASLAAWPVISGLHNQGRIGRLQRGLPAQKIDKNRSHA